MRHTFISNKVSFYVFSSIGIRKCAAATVETFFPFLVPSLPKNIQFTFDGEIYTITWSPPRDSSMIIIGYKVLFLYNQSNNASSDMDKAFIVEGQETRVDVKLSSLHGSKMYIVRVQARTTKGYGHPSTDYAIIETPVTSRFCLRKHCISVKKTMQPV